jgi:hypothetical protein
MHPAYEEDNSMLRTHMPFFFSSSGFRGRIRKPDRPYLMVRIETSYERNQGGWDHFSRILDWIFPTSYSRISIGTNFFIIWFKHINQD